MTKAPDAFRTISEVAEELDLPQHVLRFWETRFSQIKPMKRGGGRRYYRPDDVNLLRGIKYLLYSEGYTIKGVQRILKELGIRAVQMEEGQEAPSLSENGVEEKAEIGNENKKDVLPAATEKDVKEEASFFKPSSIKKAIKKVEDEGRPPETEAEPAIPEGSVAKVEPKEEAVQKSKPDQVEKPVIATFQHSTGFQIPDNLVSAKHSTIHDGQTINKAPPFALTHAVPDHLVDAITSKNSLVESVALPDENKQPSKLTSLPKAPGDILSEESSKDASKKKAKGIFSRFVLEDEEGIQNLSSDSKIDATSTERLQETLVDLLECKRLLDQIR